MHFELNFQRGFLQPDNKSWVSHETCELPGCFPCTPRPPPASPLASSSRRRRRPDGARPASERRPGDRDILRPRRRPTCDLVRSAPRARGVEAPLPWPAGAIERRALPFPVKAYGADREAGGVRVGGSSLFVPASFSTFAFFISASCWPRVALSRGIVRCGSYLVSV